MHVFLIISINGLCVSRTLNPFTVMNSRNRSRLFAYMRIVFPAIVKEYERSFHAELICDVQEGVHSLFESIFIFAPS